MKLIIVIHTQTGHTSTCARAIADKFRTAGHEVDLAMLRTDSKISPRSTDFTIKNPPDIKPFDALVFGAPVWAFSASPVIMKYLSNLDNLKNKKVLNFVTKGLPFKWTGGLQALNAMNKRVAALQGNVLQGEIINVSINGKNQITPFVERVFSAFTK